MSDLKDLEGDALAAPLVAAIDVRSLFGSPVVKIVSAAALKLETGNSVVMTTGPIALAPLLREILKGGDASELKVSLNLIRVDGEMPDEPLHYHLGDILILVTAGFGYINYVDDGEERQAAVYPLDIIAIPRMALHCFTCDDGQSADYAVLEIGACIDYQAHHYR